MFMARSLCPKLVSFPQKTSTEQKNVGYVFRAVGYYF